MSAIGGGPSTASLLAGLVVLMVAGLVFLMAGGPPVAERLGLSTFHFVNRQVLFLVPAVAILVAVSFLSLRHVRRLALARLRDRHGARRCWRFQFGPEIKGAHRWIMLAGIGLQPSEFVKPAFVVLAAWAFSEGARRKDMPGAFLALLLLPATIVPLILQPDFGQTMLDHHRVVRAVLRRRPALVLGRRASAAPALVGIVAAYRLPAARARPHRALPATRSSRRHFQVDTGDGSPSSRGGWFGSGPGEGIVKRILPDAHTDFIFAVTARSSASSSASSCSLLFAFIVLRGLVARPAQRGHLLPPGRDRARADVRPAGVRSTWW